MNAGLSKSIFPRPISMGFAVCMANGEKRGDALFRAAQTAKPGNSLIESWPALVDSPVRWGRHLASSKARIPQPLQVLQKNLCGSALFSLVPVPAALRATAELPCSSNSVTNSVILPLPPRRRPWNNDRLPDRIFLLIILPGEIIIKMYWLKCNPLTPSGNYAYHLL